MDKNEIVNKTVEFIKEKFYGEGSGLDYFHIYRVYRTALYKAERENGADKYIVSLAALLHDVDDWKFTDTNETNTSNIEKFLRSVDADDDTIERVCAIIKKISFKGGVVDSTQ